MIDSLYIGATGLHAQQVNVDTVANNLANVNTAAEMVKLIETVRHFESVQKVVQGFDEMRERALRKLGEF